MARPKAIRMESPTEKASTLPTWNNPAGGNTKNKNARMENETVARRASILFVIVGLAPAQPK
jgi:hypothetical protein